MRFLGLDPPPSLSLHQFRRDGVVEQYSDGTRARLPFALGRRDNPGGHQFRRDGVVEQYSDGTVNTYLYLR